MRSKLLHMRVRYETGIATLIQFCVTTLLTLIDGVYSVISGCTGQRQADCASNTFVSLLLILLTIAGLGVLVTIGYIAQERRSTRLAQILIATESVTGLIYLFDAKQSPGIIDRFTNLFSFLIAVWVTLIAWRLARARGGRIVKLQSRHNSATKL